MSEVAQEQATAIVANPAEVADCISYWDYFSELFVPESNIDLPLHPEHKEICDVIEAAILGEIKEQFICVTMPPRIGKTTIVRGGVTWQQGYWKDSQHILSSYSDSIAGESLAFIRKTFNEAWYKEWFGDLLHGETADHLSTTQGGNLYAEGVGGSLLGRGAGLKRPAGGAIWLDDPAKNLSLQMAKNLETWFEMTLLSRRNSDRFCPIFVVAQRLGLTDLVEYLKKNYRNETLVLKFPCFVDRRSRFPETYSDDALEKAERTRLGRFKLAGMLQQEPITLGGNLIPVGDFRRHSDFLLPWEDKILVADTGLKKGQGNDWWVIQCWGRIGRKCYLLDQVRYQCNSAEFVRYASAFYQKHMSTQENHPVARFVIEDSAAGPGVISILVEAGIPVTPIQAVKDKVQRVNDVLPYIETGMVYIPRDDDPDAREWIGDFLTECSAFSADMTHEHDDQVDCLAYGLSQLLGAGLSILDVLGIAPAGG